MNAHSGDCSLLSAGTGIRFCKLYRQITLLNWWSAISFFSVCTSRPILRERTFYVLMAPNGRAIYLFSKFTEKISETPSAGSFRLKSICCIIRTYRLPKTNQCVQQVIVVSGSSRQKAHRRLAMRDMKICLWQNLNRIDNLTFINAMPGFHIPARYDMADRIRLYAACRQEFMRTWQNRKIPRAALINYLPNLPEEER